jgi:hypothetical protein
MAAGILVSAEARVDAGRGVPGMFMLLLDITIVNVALPDIQKALHSSFRPAVDR